MNFLSFFTHPAMLIGTAAGSIPIIIHILNRQRYKRVWWAAMHWLWAAYKKSHRRLQIEQLILLLIRVLILVLLAMALARPALQAGVGLLQGRPSVYRIVVLDNSFSMGLLEAGRPLFEKARERALRLVDELNASDDVTVILCNSTVEELEQRESHQRQSLLQELRTVQVSDGGSNLPRGIAHACKLVVEGRSRNLRKEIVVLTDRTRAAWFAREQPKKLRPDEEDAVRAAFADPRTKPGLWIVRLGASPDRENLALERLEVDEKVLTADVESQVVAIVRNLGVKPARRMPVTFHVDGEVALREELETVEPGQTAAVLFRHVFRVPGSHLLGASFEGDPLPNDNTAFLAADVEREIKVLCVDGQQRIGPNASELDFFRQALSPSRALEVQAGKMPLAPEVIGDGALAGANLDDYRLVVLANVARVPREKVESLRQWVVRGGALWIWLGDRVDPSAYNRELADLLPATIGDTVGAGDSEGASEALSEKAIEHPAITRFRDIKTLPLGQLRVFRRQQLAPKNVAAGAEKAEGLGQPLTVLAMENGEPLAVEARLGEGRVLLVGTSADKAWNNWPAKNHYMPLIHFIALHLIHPEYLQRNRKVGEPFVYRLGREELGPARAEGLTLRSPSKEPMQMEIAAETFTATSKPARRAGGYAVEIPGDKRRTVHFAANRSIEESDLDTVDDREIHSCVAEVADAPPERGSFFGTAPVLRDDVRLLGEEAEALSEALKRFSSGREIWTWLAMAVLVLLVVESVLAMRFGNYNR